MPNINLIKENIQDCRRCVLRNTLPVGRRPVPGVGPSSAKLMFVAEAPGVDEIEAGEPLVGQSGHIQNRILKMAGFNRHDVYIANVMNCWCRTPNGKANRPPMTQEIEDCKIWLWRQIEALQPKVIITLGKSSTYLLLNKQLKKTFTLKSVFGQPFRVGYTDAVIIPSYHPSFYLRNGGKGIDNSIELLTNIKTEYLNGK